MSARYAVYYAPPAGSPLEETAAAWLGRALDGSPRPHPPLPGWSVADINTLTAAPRAYGFHATLKAPFALAAGKDEEDLLTATETLAGLLAPLPLPPLAVTRLRHFLALIPTAPSPALQALAGRCVVDLDRFRHPETPEQQDKRRAKGLSEREDRYLTQWGYPYVFDAYRFHMTLTGPLDPTAAAGLEPHLTALFSGCGLDRLQLDEIALYRQPDSSQPFTLLRRFGLGG